MTQKDFDENEVWCEFYSSDEVEYIENQLSSKDLIDELFWNPHHEGEECYYPIRNLIYLPRREFLFIASEIIITPENKFTGYVSVVCNEIVSASIWLSNNDEIDFYRSDRLAASEENQRSLSIIKEKFGIEDINVIAYKSKYILSNNTLVEGSLKLL